MNSIPKILALQESENCFQKNDKIYEKCCVIAYLYYLEDVEKYLQYFENVPEKIYIYVFSSRSEVLDRIKQLVREKTYLKSRETSALVLTLKENRGRDLSTLLVAAKDIVKEYEYFCFVHDKRPISPHLAEDTNTWCEELWENLLGSRKYIENILLTFESEKIGMALPPLPMGEYIDFWYNETWDLNKDNTIKLCKSLGIEDDSLFDNMPSSLGSCFWARTEAIRNIFDRKWEYDDFPSEPMPTDGTISHAIERSFEYISKANGYPVRNVMTTEYAAKSLSVAQDYCRIMFSQLNKRENVFMMHHIRNMDEREKKVFDFISNKQEIYIYGAGIRGKAYYEFLKSKGIKPAGFIVSKKGKESSLNEVPIIDINHFKKTDDNGIIIAVAYESEKEIVSTLQKLGVNEFTLGYI